MAADVPGRLHVLVANPSPDVYGADLQVLDSITGLRQAGHRVTVSVPGDGPLVPQLRERGAAVVFTPVPPVQRAALSPRGLLRLARGSAVAVARTRSLLRRLRVDVVYVNTITVPAWIVGGRAAGLPVLCHVHEAENADRAIVLKALLAPLRAATALVANSRAAVEALTAVHPALGPRTTLVYNGIPGVPDDPRPPQPRGDGVLRLAAVCRLSPRKAPDVALEALALVRADGVDARLTLHGTAFTGYEWYEQQLRERAARPDLAGAVTFAGYTAPVWPALAEADAVLAPSLREPFGNAVVEAQFAARPVVASATLGHLETVRDGETGLLVPPGDAAALAAAVRRLADDPELVARLAAGGLASAREHFTVERYRREITAAVEHTAARRRRRSRRASRRTGT